jgi:hypothetical protein
MEELPPLLLIAFRYKRYLVEMEVVVETVAVVAVLEEQEHMVEEGVEDPRVVVPVVLV